MVGESVDTNNVALTVTISLALITRQFMDDQNHTSPSASSFNAIHLDIHEVLSYDPQALSIVHSFNRRFARYKVLASGDLLLVQYDRSFRMIQWSGTEFHGMCESEVTLVSNNLFRRFL